MKSIFFIDGFNLYHSLRREYKSKYRWLNIRKLCNMFIQKNEIISDIYYFSAYADWDKRKVNRHKTYIQALENEKIKIILGEFKKKTVFCKKCKRSFIKYEEKKTDVNIAINLLKNAFNNTFDTAYIVSGDSDFVPIIQMVKELFPEKKINLLLPPGSKSINLRNNCDKYMRTKEHHIKNSQFPKTINLENDKTLYCPEKWCK